MKSPANTPVGAKKLAKTTTICKYVPNKGSYIPKLDYKIPPPEIENSSNLPDPPKDEHIEE